MLISIVPHVKDAFPDIERTLPDVEQTLLDVEQTLLDIEQTLLDIEQTLLDIEQMLLDIERLLLDVEQTSLHIERLLVRHVLTTKLTLQPPNAKLLLMQQAICRCGRASATKLRRGISSANTPSHTCTGSRCR